MRSWAWLYFCFPLIAGAQPAPKAYENLNAVSWMQTSAEYAAAATQTYRSAAASLRLALADPHWSAAFEQTPGFEKLPPAVILDLDETVLDNSPFQARLTKSGAAFSDDAWAGWVKEAKAGAVPGAVAFLQAAYLGGVEPFFISNRVCNPNDAADPTVRTLQTHRIPIAPNRLLCRTGASDKSERRRAVAATHRILLLIGDDFGDFTSYPPDIAGRDALRRQYDPFWGHKWFVLPNPTYGSWEGAVGRSVEQKLRQLRE